MYHVDFCLKWKLFLLTVLALSFGKQGNFDYIKVYALNCFYHCFWLGGWQKKLIKLGIQRNFSKSVVCHLRQNDQSTGVAGLLRFNGS